MFLKLKKINLQLQYTFVDKWFLTFFCFYIVQQSHRFDVRKERLKSIHDATAGFLKQESSSIIKYLSFHIHPFSATSGLAIACHGFIQMLKCCHILPFYCLIYSIISVLTRKALSITSFNHWYRRQQLI